MLFGCSVVADEFVEIFQTGVRFRRVIFQGCDLLADTPLDK